MTTINQTQCSLCRHYRESVVGTGSCDAFPDGIPFDVWSGAVLHNEPLEGDNGVQFELTSDAQVLAALKADE